MDNMKPDKYKIHANKGKVLDCTCAVNVECDEETIAFRFPQLECNEDTSPMVYAHMRGTELRVTLCAGDDKDFEFAWDEGARVWRQQEVPS